VFALNTDGTGFTNLYNLTPTSGPYPATNSDGSSPNSLILSGNTFYGTTVLGGSYGWGTVFRLNLDGTGFTNLHNFTAVRPIFYTNTDGGTPVGLVLSGRTLYGTSEAGGNAASGTVFAVDTNGSNFKVLYNLAGNPNNGTYQVGGLIMSGDFLYGTTSEGGNWGEGTVFSLLVPPELTIVPSGTDVILTWPSNYTGFTLQSTTNLASPTVWNTNLSSPVVVNGQNTVTNPITGMQQFYRLSE
jgi:uncharacterized repeat protein (TIGR03803 family)